MAIYHFSVKPISRSGGRCATGAAAYRSGEKVYDERQDKLWYYPGKSKGVLFCEILTPDNVPEWMKDREKLWNAAEAAENRKDSRVAKELEIALPKELSVSENARLLKEFISENFVKEGIVADISIHDQDRGNQNIHSHVMLTTRCATSVGLSDKKALFLDKKECLIKWRESWANIANKYLALNGYDIQIDHRSHEEQGIDLVPQNKRGPKFTRKRLVEKTKEHIEIARQNGERIYQDPKIALHALSTQHSTFTKQDIARFINRHTDGPEQFTRVFEKVYNSPELVVLGIDQKGSERYSHKEMVRLEKEMIDIAQVLSEKHTHDVSNPEHDRISMMVSRASRNIKEVFVGEGKRFDYATLSEDQKTALEHITKGNDLSFVLGYAGTGKSYMLGAAREVWEREGYRVRGLSLTGVAARSLEDGSGINSQTIARQFRSWENGREALSERDIVVLDEIGMVGSRLLHRVLGYTKNAGAKLVGTGDFSQLPSIEAGGARAVVEKVGYVELTEIRRQVESWQQEATRQLARGEIEEAIDSYHKKGYVHNEKDGMDIEQQMLDKWAKNLTEQSDKTQIMIAFTNEEVRQLNLQARDIMGELGILSGDDYEVVASGGKLKIAEHEKILFLKNNYDLGVMNGMLGEVSSINQNEVSVVINKGMDNQQEITFNVERYNYFTYGYAATVHKLQGATFDNTQILVSKYFNLNLANVAFTRHRYEMNIYHPHSDIPELVKTLSRDGSKDTTLDYPYINKEILNYREIQELGDLGYTAFHHRELVKELELVGGKAVSFMTSKQERGFIAGIVKHNDKQYLVLEQEKEFKLYNEKFFYDNNEKELIDSVGCFVTITKKWDETHRGFNAVVSNTGLSLLERGESYDAKEQNVFVLGGGVRELQKEITTLETQYHKPINFSSISEDIYGIYRGFASVGEKEYGVVETVSSLRMVAKETFEGIENDKWIFFVGDNQKIITINQQEVPAEHIFGVKQTVLGRDGSFVVDAIHKYEPKTEHYEVEEIKRALTNSAESVVEHLMGEPNAKLSSSVQWRYGNKGSLAVSVAGERRGFWYDFESGESGDLIKLIQKRTGMRFPETLKYAASISGGSYLILPRSNPVQSRLEPTHEEISKTSEYAQRLVAESKSIEGTIVERYLKEVRSISNISDTDLRYHPKVFTNKQESKQYLPAMLSIGRDKDGNVQCVQATYLDSKTANKAGLDVNKRTYASPSGALVHLQKQDGTIEDKTSYITEGVETGLSIKDAIEGGEVVATLGKSNFAKVDPQSIGQKVVFCLDNDGSSTRQDITIHKAAERLINFGKEVFIAIPESKATNRKIDFNDVAKTSGIDAVRNNIKHPVPYLEWKYSIEKEAFVGAKEVSEAEKLAKEMQGDKVIPDSSFSSEESIEDSLTKDSVRLNNIEQGAQEDEKTVKELAEEIRILREAAEQEVRVEKHVRELQKLAYGTDQGNVGYTDTLNNQDDVKAVEAGDLEDFQKRFESKNPKLAAKIREEVNGEQNTQDNHEILSVKSLDSRLEKIRLETANVIDSINYYSATRDENKKEENPTSFKEAIAENRAEIVKCLREHCGRDKEMIGYIMAKEPQLFNEINRVCGNVLNNTLKQLESKELLEKLTQEQPGLYEKVLATENQYKVLKQDYLEKEGLTKGKAEDWNEYSSRLGALIEAEKNLEQYAHKIGEDIDLIQMIGKHNPELFTEMDQRFDGIFTEAIKQHEVADTFAKAHPEFCNDGLSIEERNISIYEHYKDLKGDYLEKESIIHTQAEDWNEYSNHLDDLSEAEEQLQEYAHHASQHKRFMEYLSTHDENTFNEINKM